MFTLGKALPDKLDMKELYDIQDFTLKIMKQYIDKVSSEPQQYIQNKTALQRFMHSNPKNTKFPIMYNDTFLPSFTNAMLYGLEFDFCIMQVLVIASMDRLANLEQNDITSRLVLGVLVAHLLDGFLTLMR